MNHDTPHAGPALREVHGPNEAGWHQVHIRHGAPDDPDRVLSEEYVDRPLCWVTFSWPGIHEDDPAARDRLAAWLYEHGATWCACGPSVEFVHGPDYVGAVVRHKYHPAPVKEA